MPKMPLSWRATLKSYTGPSFSALETKHLKKKKKKEQRRDCKDMWLMGKSTG